MFFLLSNNLILKKAYILLQKTVTKYCYNSNITVTIKVEITITIIIFQNKKSNIYGTRTNHNIQSVNSIVTKLISLH